MKKYLVGGAVRDLLLGRKSKDLDYVVFNTTEAELLESGFQKISKNFPVFSHPDFKNCQYALPRKDVKIGKGYNGFKVETSNVSLRDDLERRDFTINAMALDEDTKTIVDFFNGQEDLKNKVIRHVGKHFVEDPLRVLRAARFKSRYKFSIHPSTQALIDEMMALNMLNEIPASRFLQEFKTTETEGNLVEFVLSLDEMSVLQHIFSSFDYNIVKDNLKFLNKKMSLNEVLSILSFGQNLTDLKGNNLFKALSNFDFMLVSSLNRYCNNIEKYSTLTDQEKILLYTSGLSYNRFSNFRHTDLGAARLKLLKFYQNDFNLSYWLELEAINLIFKLNLNKTFLKNYFFYIFNHVYKLLKIMKKVPNNRLKTIILNDWNCLSNVDLSIASTSSNPKETVLSLLIQALQKSNNWK